MSIINSKDDVFTVLIHLGYLGYDRNTGTCYIPNRELFEVLTNAIGETSWKRLSDALTASEHLLSATLNCDEKAVALGVDLAHDENTSILSYNDENSLSCVLAIAYYYARKDYIIHREFASGKGFADLVMIPRATTHSPAIVVELKIDSAVDTAIDQIVRREYPTGDMLLVGISYDRRNKHHSCRIERYTTE